jgi:hypothetical protein
MDGVQAQWVLLMKHRACDRHRLEPNPHQESSRSAPPKVAVPRRRKRKANTTATTRFRANWATITQAAGVVSAVLGSRPRSVSQALPNTMYHTELATNVAAAATATAQ